MHLQSGEANRYKEMAIALKGDTHFDAGNGGQQVGRRSGRPGGGGGGGGGGGRSGRGPRLQVGR